ncbi:8-oxoguanine DNA glycosylase OGG fold protein [Streptomyces sp. NPDC055287]
MASPEDLFRDPPPDRESYVLSQAIPFSPQHWLTRLPVQDWWPKALDIVPAPNRWPTVDRRTVFRMAEQTGTLRQRRDLLIAALVWGTGTSAQRVARRTRILHDNDAKWLDERLCEAFAKLHDGDPVAAYLVMNDRDERVKHLGPAFFSKVLYFATADRPVGVRWPLIIDSNVALALDDLTSDKWDAGMRWDSGVYTKYLELAHSWARQWEAEPDVVERKLFEYGKRLRNGST